MAPPEFEPYGPEERAQQRRAYLKTGLLATGVVAALFLIARSSSTSSSSMRGASVSPPAQATTLSAVPLTAKPLDDSERAPEPLQEAVPREEGAMGDTASEGKTHEWTGPESAQAVGDGNILVKLLDGTITTHTLALEALPVDAIGDWAVELLSGVHALGDVVKCTGDSYVYCGAGACTKNPDGKTASCGCAYIPPGDTDGTLHMGWYSYYMIRDPTYIALSRALYHGASTETTDKLKYEMCAKMVSATVWKGYGFSMETMGTSISGDHNGFSRSNHVSCDSFPTSTAQCMGTPCFHRKYNDQYDTTCICPYSTQTTGSFHDQHSGFCLQNAAKGLCAGVGSVTVEHNVDGLRKQLRALEDSYPKTDEEKCPCYDDDDGDDYDDDAN